MFRRNMRLHTQKQHLPDITVVQKIVSNWGDSGGKTFLLPQSSGRKKIILYPPNNVYSKLPVKNPN